MSHNSTRKCHHHTAPEHVPKSKILLCENKVEKKFNEPTSASELAFPAGIATMLRLPIARNTDGLDACFVGVPIDHGTSNRSGARFGPRQIRSESVIVRKCNIQAGADPFSSIQVADIGDVRVNLYNLKKCCDDIKKQYEEIIKNGCRPLSIGGDHTISYPILQAMAEKYGPVAMVHVDAHSDCNSFANGEKITHGTAFRLAIEENLIIPTKVFQIGLRGSVGSLDSFDWQLDKGFRMIHAKDLWYKSLTPLMKEVRDVIGETPTYICFDIDALDPSAAPGTGFPEIGGLTTSQALEIIRGCRGLNIIGADMVEVAPPYDTTGTTAITAANILFEILCVLPGVKYHETPATKKT
ncbi:agmatinase, mitochondrial-like isoform X1 [Styela clava]|uniref:agmatinase, mitochondrial-like isoform X2 n=1 Tax=Styela clava TaxID=7725 RepID=UPI0019393437|nr:agmatinase, mitochondrial-like isoform X2 [Styela clava]